MSTDTTEQQPIRRRKRLAHGKGQNRAFWAPDSEWHAALAACQERTPPVSLSSQLVRALERIAAGETL